MEEDVKQEDGKQLERLGYTFEAQEKPITEAGGEGSYYQVTIRHNGLALGTRSELKRDRALARAYKFARRHSEGENPDSV